MNKLDKMFLDKLGVLLNKLGALWNKLGVLLSKLDMFEILDVIMNAMVVAMFIVAAIVLYKNRDSIDYNFIKTTIYIVMVGLMIVSLYFSVR